MEFDLLFQWLFFCFFAVLGIGGGIGLITLRNPIMAALCLILNFFSIAGLYLSLQAEFLAIIQILVYAGAIMVLFLFVIMLLNMKDETKQEFDTTRGIAFILGLAFVAEMGYVFSSFADNKVTGAFSMGKVESIGLEMMTNFIFPFEMISVVLLAALIGAVVIAKKYTYK